MHRIRIAVLPLLAVLLSCSTFEPDSSAEARFESELRAWRAQGIQNYTFIYRYRGELLPAMTRPIRIEVRQGRVTSAVYVDNGASPTHAPPDMEALFARLHDAIKNDFHEIKVEYDKTYHFPRDMWLDESATVADEEWGCAVSEFYRL